LGRELRSGAREREEEEKEEERRFWWRVGLF